MNYYQHIYIYVLLSKKNFNNDKKWENRLKNLQKKQKYKHKIFTKKFKAFLRVIHQIETYEWVFRTEDEHETSNKLHRTKCQMISIELRWAVFQCGE